MKFNQATVPSTDVSRAVEFYRTLGLIQIVDSSPRYARFTFPDNDASLSMHLRSESDAPAATVLYFECDDLDEKVADLKERGIKFDSEPTDQRWLWREAYLKDPDGNIICLFKAGNNRLNPPWRIPVEPGKKINLAAGMTEIQFCLRDSTLRRWRGGDEESLAHHANNRKIWRNVRDIFPNPYTTEDASDWIRKASNESPIVNFAIECNGAAVGGIGLILKDDVSRVSAEIGYWLGEEYWSRGIVTEGVRKVTEYGFEHLGLTRIFAAVFEWNQGSMRVLEKAGYQLEARLRKAAIKEGRIIDEYQYAKVKGD